MRRHIKIKTAPRPIRFIVQLGVNNISNIEPTKEKIWSKFKMGLLKSNLFFEIAKSVIIFLVKQLFKLICAN